MAVVQFQTMPPLSPDEYRQLEASCLKHGIQVPIIVDEIGAVIDGHHRQKIAQEHGLYLPTETRDTLTDSEKTQLSITLNIDRRQLTREQRREIIAASIKADPEASNREHARRTGADHKTVDTVRTGLQESGEIPHFSERRDPRTGNASQPATKSSPVLGVSDWTVKTDLQRGRNLPPEPQTMMRVDPATGVVEDVPARHVTGMDGKSYAVPVQKKPLRPASADTDSAHVALLNDLRGPWSRGITSTARRATPRVREHIVNALQAVLDKIKEMQDDPEV